ncbi:MAG: ammonium transporter [Bacillota bacterium]|nr:ammonium transporter [Bacillota bacterium]
MDQINLGDCAFVLVSTALVFFMTPGLALFYGGMVKRKNVLNTIMACFFVAGLGSVLWVLVGYSLSFGGNSAFLGNFQYFALNGVGDAPNADYAATIPHLLFAAFQMMFAIITPTLISGALAERMKFSSLFIFAALWSIIVYYPLVHMIWGTGGLLKNIGAIDFAGGNVVHISSGISGLVACIMLGRRKGYPALSTHPHNIPLVFIGAGILWFGWFGFNAGSALTSGPLAVHALMTTNTSGATALLSWMLVEKIVRGKPTMLGAATGAVVGLAAVTQGAGYVPIWAAFIIGGLVSPICYFAMTVIKSKFGYDDALDAFGCHGVGGIWGGIATGLFANHSVNPAVKWDGLVFGDARLLGAQLISIVVTITLSAVGTFLIISVIKLFMKIRVEGLEESEGLDLTEHGENAYPAFTGLD